MNVQTGQVYKSYDAALFDAAKPEDVVEIVGTREAVSRVGSAVAAQAKAKEQRRAANKRARQSRKANR